MNQKGFTLIELMIVVAIVGILIGFAVPSYTDSIKKSYVASGISAANSLISNYKLDNLTYPQTNFDMGPNFQTEIHQATPYVTSININDNLLTIVFGNQVPNDMQGRTLVMGMSKSSIQCQSTDLDPAWWPKSCKDQINNPAGHVTPATP